MTEPVTGIVTPIRLDYRYTPGKASSDFLRDIKEGKVSGRFPGTATIRAKSGSVVGTATITVKIGG